MKKLCLPFSVLAVSSLGQFGVLAEEPKTSTQVQGSEDLDLRGVMDRAMNTHPTIAAAEANARAAGADVSAAKWQRFPSFSVEGLLLTQAGNGLQAQAVVDQPLWTGGRIAGVIGRAKARDGAAQAGYDEAVLNVALSAAKAFFEVHRWRERVALLKQSLEQHSGMVETMARRYEQEVSPLSDLELARSRALQVEQQLYQARAQESSASSRLHELVGDPFFVIGALPQLPASWPSFEDDGVLAQVLAFSPQLKKLRFEAEGADADVRIAKASILPQLNGQYTYSDAYGHRVGVVLKAQSDGGFSRFAAVDAARARGRASEFQVTASERQLRDQLFTLLRDYDASTSRLAGSQAASGSAQRVMESYMRQFASGRRTWLDVMNAVREATTADVDVVEARISAQSSLVQILLMSGQWAPDAMGGGE